MEVDPRTNHLHQRWLDKTIDLAAFQGQTVCLTLKTSTPVRNSSEYCWAGWSDPVLEHLSIPIKSSVKKSPEPLILLVTSDALRYDHLGCYGNSVVKTPHLDQLAEEGCLFTHARTSSTTTMGGYASLLSGKHCIEHGCQSEWGEVPLDSLPRYLSSRGYHTLFANSESELNDPGKGVNHLFDETIPCMGRPAQDGAITTRGMINWLNHRHNQATFIWAQYFDTHPPHSAPEPYRSMYYSGDPTDPKNSFYPDNVRKIHGLETLLELTQVIPQLDQGRVNESFIQRLQDTAKHLMGEEPRGPDLSAHLFALGADACLGLSPSVFGSWLLEESIRLKSGPATPELKNWIFAVYPKLRFIEQEILSWLDGVTDFRFPIGQYKASVSYLDHQVGMLIQALKELGVYDHATIILTSPHGEILDESSFLCFHHHMFTEQTMRIPMIIKPAKHICAESIFKQGTRIDGVFDIIDLYPTLIDALRLPIPDGISGVSRWKNLLTGSSIPEHDSFAEDMCGTMVSLARPPFIYFKASGKTFQSPEWDWEANDSGLYKLAESMPYQENLLEKYPEIAASMDARLTDLMRTKKPVE